MGDTKKLEEATEMFETALPEEPNENITDVSNFCAPPKEKRRRRGRIPDANSGSEHMAEERPIIRRRRGNFPRPNDRLKKYMCEIDGMWRKLENQFGSMNQFELLGVAEMLAKKGGIVVDRDARRRKTVLLCWFCENWDAIKDHLSDKDVIEAVVE